MIEIFELNYYVPRYTNAAYNRPVNLGLNHDRYRSLITRVAVDIMRFHFYSTWSIFCFHSQNDFTEHARDNDDNSVFHILEKKIAEAVITHFDIINVNVINLVCSSGSREGHEREYFGIISWENDNSL